MYKAHGRKRATELNRGIDVNEGIDGMDAVDGQLDGRRRRHYMMVQKPPGEPRGESFVSGKRFCCWGFACLIGERRERR